jgi:hypothetical protein
MEEWREIKDFPNYSVSNSGNILNTKTNKMMKLNKKSGYYHISLTNNTNKKSLLVHRLVAMAFIPNPENKSDVNHKDKDKLNNNLSNLEWMTRKENNSHKSQTLVYKSNKNKPLLRIDSDTNEIIEKYDSIELAGIWACNNHHTKTTHNGRNAIGNCVNGLSKCAYGFKWEYENKYEDLENEIWREVIIKDVDITIYGNKKYYVSNLGRFKDSEGLIRDNYKVNENGYIRVYIYNKTYAVHRLIAFAFLENPDNKEQVNHIDGNKLNNTLDNLEWVTNKENQVHKFKTGLGNNFTRTIIQYDLEGNLIKKFTSIVSAAKEMGVSKGNIQGVLLNKRKTAAGFIWKYLEDETPDFSKKIAINKNRGRQVAQYDLNMNLLNIYDSTADASRKVNVHKNNIWAVISNFRKTAGGFIWKYLD